MTVNATEVETVPHLIVEYSSNLEGRFDLDALLDRLHETALSTGMFPLGGIRIRAYAAHDYRIADCAPDNAFVHVTAIVGSGRPLDRRHQVAEQLFDVVCTELESLYANSPLAISFNMREFDPVLNLKRNNLHEHVRARSAPGDGGDSGPD
jgi:5-carboxymethyl-2-hydroxymuconate isomerase